MWAQTVGAERKEGLILSEGWSRLALCHFMIVQCHKEAWTFALEEDFKHPNYLSALGEDLIIQGPHP